MNNDYWYPYSMTTVVYAFVLGASFVLPALEYLLRGTLWTLGLVWVLLLIVAMLLRNNELRVRGLL